MTIGNYSYFYDAEIPTHINCRSGLLVAADNAASLGGWYYNNQPLGGLDTCGSRSTFATLVSSLAPGALTLTKCNNLTLQSEGLYICVIRDTDMIVHEFKVGFYFNRGGNHKFCKQ